MSARFGLRSILAALLALVGLILVGQGLYIHAKAALAQVLLERAFAQSLATGAPVKAWGWADTWPVARIEVPRLKQSAIALRGASGEALAFGPGHLDGTPQAGERGTAIYAAHRDTHFAFLKDVKAGDEIVVRRADGAAARFRVDGTRVVRWDASGLDPHAPGRNLALVTCWPFDATARGPLRYVVEAEAVDNAVDPAN
ncbi:class GN sortase [Chelatococcus sambhunathii]|uniref:Class GN sortase n=1 Tax=Chelatococcus sambhunathii TaxID=363953 RepID=A0ABU1DIP6_9HYPH|nr:class GN sortase [Chelatococcus sambhunathii]MDR4308006.1 class GN sortase [Chelatococcus sambhunathii]